MKLPLMRTLITLLLLAGATGSVSAQMFTCKLVDGKTSFQQLPCDESPQADLPAPGAPVAGASSSSAKPPPPGSPQLLTRGKREVLQLTTVLERCRADEPGFAERSAAVYVAWRQRHAATLAEFDRLLAAKVREARRGVAPIPLEMCSDDLLRRLEPLARPPDARLDTAEKTWTLFLTALRSGNREMALRCLTGKAELRWKERAERASDADLRRMADTIRAFKVQWGDDYLKEALAARADNKVSGITFIKFNDEWLISEL
jgi:hypothetical protein